MACSQIVVCSLVLATSTVVAQTGSPQQNSGSTSGATNAVPPPPVEHAGPVRVSGGITVGMLKSRVAPVYPYIAIRQGITGAVVLHAIIGKDGKVKNLEAISGPDVLKEAALVAVRQWKYKPYLLNGEPTEIETTITVNFDLNNKRK